MSYLSYISDSDLERHVKHTVNFYRSTIDKMDLSKFNSNIIDPIKLTFDSIIYNRKVGSIIIDEIARQRDKSNANSIGYFHQNIFAYIKGCSIPAKGFDIVFRDDSREIYVELKNKHNTMNASSSQKTYMNMQNQIIINTNCECFLVEVISKHSQNNIWKMSLNYSPVANEKIRRVSIDKFYEIITGEKDAFMHLCKVIPVVLQKIVQETIASEIEQDTVFEELAATNSDLLKAIYLLAFKTYEGFDKF